MPFEVGILIAKFLIEVGHIIVEEQTRSRWFHSGRACLEMDGLHGVLLLTHLHSGVLDGREQPMHHLALDNPRSAAAISYCPNQAEGWEYIVYSL